MCASVVVFSVCKYKQLCDTVCGFSTNPCNVWYILVLAIPILYGQSHKYVYICVCMYIIIMYAVGAE